jgi:hypothetical protein
MIRFYKKLGLYYLDDQVHPPGKCYLVRNNDDTEFAVKNVADGTYTVPFTPIGEYVDEQGNPYADLESLLTAVGGFFVLEQGVGTINGQIPGTFFGDDFSVTNRIAKIAAKWSQGLPTNTIAGTFVNGGYWRVEDDENDANYHDGCAVFATSTNPAGKMFVTTIRKNRYQPGHLSYYGYTAGWNIEGANGDFIALVGAFLRGSKEQGKYDLIKDAMCWGIVRESGVTKYVFRLYKNYVLTVNEEIKGVIDEIDTANLNIFEHQVGYYGIHPSIIWYFNQAEKKHQLLHYRTFEQKLTSVSDPNMALGAYVENKGNTTDIKICSGSAEFGNYITRQTVGDASARPLPVQISIASIAVDPDDTDGSGFVVAFRVADMANMVKQIDQTGLTLAEFQNTIANQLLNVNAIGSANKVLTLNLYFVPSEDVTATFTAVNEPFNVLERADTATIDFTNAVRIASFIINTRIDKDVRDFEFLLENGSVAVLTLTSSQPATATDIEILLSTQDLF